MASFLRRALQLKLTDNKAKLFISNIRCSSTAPQPNIVESPNGERIINSPYGDITFPEMPVSEYIWRDVNKYLSKIALECGVTGRKYTYTEARDYSNYVARSLINIGFKYGDVIAVVLPNLPETGIAFPGCLEAGLTITTINPSYTVDEIARQLTSSGAKGVITSSDIAIDVSKAARSVLPPNSPLIVVDYDGDVKLDGYIPFKDLITRGKSLPQLPSTPWSFEDVPLLPYSSGTTGLPKGVMLTHKNLIANMEMHEQTIAGTLWDETTDTHQEIIPVVLPLYHMYGMNTILYTKLSLGFKLVTLPKFTTDGYVNLLTNHKATILVLVPPIILFLISSKNITKKHLESVKCVVSGAAPFSEDDARRFYDKFEVDINTLKFCQGYGLTETSPVTTMEITGTKYASVGKPIKGCRMRIVDPQTNEDVKGPREKGELWISGPHVMKGYLNNEEATREIIKDGWLKSGDMGYYDEESDFYVTDRIKELIKVKGYQVAPAELESLLRTHPDVEEAAVIGIPDEKCGEVPKAFVMLREGRKVREEDIKNYVKGKVSKFKELQGGVTFVDSIPKNPTGKILRIQLKREYVK